jgi:hypothetical protein
MRCQSSSGAVNPVVPVSMWWMRTCSAFSLAKPVRWVPTVSDSFTLPCCANCRMATATNGLTAEPRLTAAPSWLRIPFSLSAMP